MSVHGAQNGSRKTRGSMWSGQGCCSAFALAAPRIPAGGGGSSAAHCPGGDGPSLSLGLSPLLRPRPSVGVLTKAVHVAPCRVDGLHSFDLQWLVKNRPLGYIAQLAKSGVTYTQAHHAVNSDSFPGIAYYVTGGWAAGQAGSQVAACVHHCIHMVQAPTPASCPAVAIACSSSSPCGMLSCPVMLFFAQVLPLPPRVSGAFVAADNTWACLGLART